MGFSGSFASSLGYNDPGLAATDLSGPNGGMGNTPAPTTAQGIGQFAGSVGSTLFNLGGAAFNAVTHPVEDLANATMDVPFALHNAVGAVKEVSALATGNHQAYVNAANQVGQANKNQFVTKELQSKNDLSNFGHAAEISGTALTLGAPGLGSLPGDAAEKGTVSLADRILGQGKDFLGVGKGNVVSKTVRNALLTQPTIQFAGKTWNDVAQGKLESAAMDAAMWGLPGAASLVAKPIRVALSATGDAMFGKSGILTDIFSPEVVQKYAQAHPEDVATMKQIEQFTLNQRSVGGKTELGSAWLKNHIQAKIPNVTADEQGLGNLVANMKPYAEEMNKLQELQDAGKTVTNVNGKEIPASKLTVSHNFVAAAPKMMEAVYNSMLDPRWASDAQFKIQETKAAVASLGIADETINAQLVKAVSEASSPMEAMNNLQEVIQAGQKQVVKDLGNGFVYTSSTEDAARMPTQEEVANNEIIQGKAPTKVAGAIGKVITKAGLSPRAVPDAAVHAQVQANLDKRLEEAGVSTSGSQLLNILKDKASQNVDIGPLTINGPADLRMLSPKAIDQAVKNSQELSDLGGKNIAKMVRGAYRDLPTSMVGAGNKLTNAVMNPLLSSYLRLQGMGRFEANPIFLFGKLPIKGGFVAAAHGANVSDMIKAFVGASKDSERALAEDSGGFFGAGSRAGEAGTESEGAAINPVHQVARPLRAEITGLAESMAKAHNTTVQAILDEKGDLYNQLQEGASLIKGYGKGGYLNSPLAKTLNLVVFPSRFDTKVVMAAGKMMAQMSPLQQTAVIHATANLYGFLNSPEGKQWQQQNADAIGLLSYFTPLDTVSGVKNFIDHGQHLGDLGEFGGLPFGILTLGLEHQLPNPDLGTLGQSQQYNEQGQPYATAIPSGDIPRAQQVFQDLISSMFSWPGQSAGLVSKKNIVTAGGKNPLTTPSSLTYTYANGSTEGSPNVPEPLGATSVSTPALPSEATAPAVPSLPNEATKGTTSAPAKIARPKAPKTVPLSEQLPGSAAIAAGQ